MRHENTRWNKNTYLSAIGSLRGFMRRAGPALAMSAAGFLVVVSTGCEDQIEERDVAKGIESVPDAAERDAPGTDAPRADSPESGGEQEPWVVPDGWERDRLTRQMRYATFMINDAPGGPAEVAITRFPGDVGGVLANVNRWRGQAGLGPAGEDELEQLITRFGPDRAPGYLLRLDGATTTMLAAGVYEAASEQTWFVRVTTTAEVADAVEEEVFAFARTMAGRLAAGGDGR